MKIQKQAGIRAYKADGFVGRYQKLIADTVIPYQYEVLCDRAGGEKSHVRENFINAARALRGEDAGDGFYGMVFQDSDAAKWLEAAAYSLACRPDPKLEAEADELISLIAAAQDKDGYLNTRFTISDRDKRWTNLLEGHELYCAGHMIEAAAAYYESTGKRTLLEAAEKNALHIYRRFVEEGKPGCPGHPEIELALMKLSRVTGDGRFMKAAEHFVNIRGTDPDYFSKERAARDWTVWGSSGEDGEYQQSARPVRELKDAAGHAVRAVYLYTAMADLASETDDKELLAACQRLWESITQRRMYVTGGIGSTVHGEAFSVDYDLPSDTAYAETCASIGLMFFASRMLEIDPDGCYADVMERAFYNTVLAGMSEDGKRFFYVNPLEIIPGISGAAPTHRHALPERPSWFACACCPPNAARTIMSLGKYAYGESEDTAYCHLFASGSVELGNGIAFECETAYPFGFDVTYRIKKGGRLAVRIPGWSRTFRLTLNDEKQAAEPVKGYVYIEVRDGDTLKLELDDSPAYIYASPRVPALSQKACIRRGPLIYCFEGTDNGGDVLSLCLDAGGSIEISGSSPFDGVPALKVSALRYPVADTLYFEAAPEPEPCKALAIPYFLHANRGLTPMRLWFFLTPGRVAPFGR